MQGSNNVSFVCHLCQDIEATVGTDGFEQSPADLQCKARLLAAQLGPVRSNSPFSIQISL